MRRQNVRGCHKLEREDVRARTPDRRRRSASEPVPAGADPGEEDGQGPRSPRRRSRSTRTSTRRRSAATSRPSASSASAGSATRRLAARGDPQDPPHPGPAQHRARRRRPARRGDRLARRSSPSTASRSPRSSTATRRRSGRPLGGVAVSPLDDLDEIVRDRNIVVGVLAVPADAAQDAADALVGGGRQDRLQLLAGPDRHAVGRAGAHLEPGRRAPLRPVLPPHLRP